MIRNLYKKYKEIILYIMFGGFTTVVSILSYIMFLRICKENALIANLFSWICAVLFAYITNRIFVFESKNHGLSKVVKEMAGFFGGRLATLIMEEIILWAGISLFAMNAIVIKLFAQVLVLVGNYLISKFLIF